VKLLRRLMEFFWWAKIYTLGSIRHITRPKFCVSIHRKIVRA